MRDRRQYQRQLEIILILALLILNLDPILSRLIPELREIFAKQLKAEDGMRNI